MRPPPWPDSWPSPCAWSLGLVGLPAPDLLAAFLRGTGPPESSCITLMPLCSAQLSRAPPNTGIPLGAVALCSPVLQAGSLEQASSHPSSLPWAQAAACLVTHRLSEHTQPLNLQLVQRPGKLCSRAPSASTAATSGPRRGLSGCHHHGDQAVTPEHGGRGVSAHPGLPLHKHVESTRWERRGYRDLKPPVLQRGAGALCQAGHTAVNPGLLSSFLALGAHWTHNYLKKCLRTKEDTLVAKG